MVQRNLTVVPSISLSCTHHHSTLTLPFSFPLYTPSPLSLPAFQPQCFVFMQQFVAYMSLFIHGSGSTYLNLHLLAGSPPLFPFQTALFTSFLPRQIYNFGSGSIPLSSSRSFLLYSFKKQHRRFFKFDLCVM